MSPKVKYFAHFRYQKLEGAYGRKGSRTLTYREPLKDVKNDTDALTAAKRLVAGLSPRQNLKGPELLGVLKVTITTETIRD
jgi:hypothetical protein